LMAPARNAAPKATAACVRSKYAILALKRGRRFRLPPFPFALENAPYGLRD
jgi:hypothetical protein